MKKSNKTYHMQQQITRKPHTSSPGKITKNQHKSTKSKPLHHNHHHHTQQHSSYQRNKHQLVHDKKHHEKRQFDIGQLREQELRAINRKVEQQMMGLPKQQPQRNDRWEEESEMRSSYSYGGESNPRSSLSHGSSLNTHGRSSQIDTQVNPYQQIFLNDKRYLQQYFTSTSKYESNGINLNWPYYFLSNHHYK